MTPPQPLSAMANNLFDRLYGQPREDLDAREIKVISEWLTEVITSAQEQAEEKVLTYIIEDAELVGDKELIRVAKIWAKTIRSRRRGK